MSTGKHTVHFSQSKAKIKDIFDYLGHYPECNFIFHMVFDSDWSTVPDIDLPLLLWHAGEAFVEDTSKLDRDFVYVTGNALLSNHFNMHDIAASKIWTRCYYKSSKRKKFLFLNGKDVGHRRYLLAHLNYNNILKDCMWSYIELTNIDSWFDPALGFKQVHCKSASSTDNIIPFAPFDNTNLARNLSQDIYHQTYCSIIGETTFQHYKDQTVPLMVTEKTYSACANLHMFIIAGAVGSLKLLRQQGFETFGDIWDESYDDITNTKDRLLAVCKTISEVNTLDMPSVYAKCKDRLLHNQNLIYSINVKSRVDQVTGWLTK